MTPYSAHDILEGMNKQINIRLPEATRERLNVLAGYYGSQSKAVIAAVEALYTEHVLKARGGLVHDQRKTDKQ